MTDFQRWAACCLIGLALSGVAYAEEAIPGLVECDKVADLDLPKAEAPNDSGLSPELYTTYERTCRMCHTHPGSGAPLTGDVEAWEPRMAQGRDVVIDHTINGYRNMPALGLCMACTEEQLVPLIEFMAGQKLK